MLDRPTAPPNGWLAFELNVLARLNFKSALLPFSGDPRLGAQLKRRGARVLTNDLTESARTKATAEIQNHAERLSDADAAAILEDAYAPGYRLRNPALRNWFGETDAWWFDNVRSGVERLSSPVARAIASSAAMEVGDYALSFTDATRELRQPLSRVFERVLSLKNEPFDNGQDNRCSNKTDYDFIAENQADLMFLRLPRAVSCGLKEALGLAAWREEWIRGGEDFWTKLDEAQAGRLGAPVQTKSQYLHLFEETLKTASHIPAWAIAHTDDGFVTTHELAETISGVRRVETIFTKDFTELAGAKAVIVTA